MQAIYSWTPLKARLQLIHQHSRHNQQHLNWLFLPGGPGLGSESLTQLTQLLNNLPGSIWHLDLPGDGSNLTADDSAYFSCWSAALLEAVSLLPNTVLVAHSTGGMYALATGELANILTGLVLMDSAPNAAWQKSYLNYLEKNPLPHVAELQKIYAENPNNTTLKNLTIAAVPYLFTAKKLNTGIKLLKKLPYNYKACEWSAQYFDQTYQATWIPRTIPTLILAGDQDHLTPIQLFSASQEFQHDNILIHEIKQAGHFPWIDNPDDVKNTFAKYIETFQLASL